VGGGGQSHLDEMRENGAKNIRSFWLPLQERDVVVARCHKVDQMGAVVVEVRAERGEGGGRNRERWREGTAEVSHAAFLEPPKCCRVRPPPLAFKNTLPAWRRRRRLLLERVCR
jgi:hypothetical protein